MQLTYFDGTVTSQGDTEREAMQLAAVAMLKVNIFFSYFEVTILHCEKY